MVVVVERMISWGRWSVWWRQVREGMGLGLV